jgi:hypothetical protein
VLGLTPMHHVQARRPLVPGSEFSRDGDFVAAYYTEPSRHKLVEAGREWRKVGSCAFCCGSDKAAAHARPCLLLCTCSDARIRRRGLVHCCVIAAWHSEHAGRLVCYAAKHPACRERSRTNSVS